MNGDVAKRLFNFVGKHYGALAFGVSALSALFAFVQAIYFANGDIRLANFLIQEVGIVQIWIGGLVAIGYSVFIGYVSLNLDITDRNFARNTNWIAGIFFWFVVWTIIPLSLILSMAVGSTVGSVFTKIMKKKVDRKKFNEKFMISLALLIALVVLIGSLNSFPVRPFSELVFDDDTTRTVTVVKNYEDKMLAINKDGRKLEYIERINIKSEQLCTDIKGWHKKTLFNVLSPDTSRLNQCSDSA